MISAPVEVRKRGKGEMKMEPERIKEDSMRENGRESEKKPLLNPNYPKVGFLERRRRKKLLNKVSNSLNFQSLGYFINNCWSIFFFNTPSDLSFLSFPLLFST